MRNYRDFNKSIIVDDRRKTVPITMYRDKDSGKVYTRFLLQAEWNDLPEDVKQDYADQDINNFNEWLECATDFSGHLEIINR